LAPPQTVHEPPEPPEPGSPLDSGVTASAGVEAWSPPPRSNIDGPHEELTLDAGRPVYYAMPTMHTMPRAADAPLRLVGHLHGMCGPPSYACGKWIGAGTDVGIMVCPTGNARCGESPYSPPSWEAPSWPELVAIMDKDLEAAVAKVAAKRPGSIRKEGAILTGYSRGAFAAPVIARRHPGRWRYLVLIEANAPLSVEGLRSSGVRSVALVAGEQGTEIAGMRKTQEDLARAGFPAQLFVMRRTGHLYSDDMELVMHDALAYVLAHEDAALDAGAP
jgi:predicted esterase